VREGLYAVTKYEPKMDKIMRMHSVTSTIENGFVYLPEKVACLEVYLHELITFPRAKYDDQADSTSQALDWYKGPGRQRYLGLIEFYKQEAARLGYPDPSESCSPSPFREAARLGYPAPSNPPPHHHFVITSRRPTGVLCGEKDSDDPKP
jgi:hypothetical protein